MLDGDIHKRELLTSEGEGLGKPVCPGSAVAGHQLFGTSELCCYHRRKPLRENHEDKAVTQRNGNF